MELGNSPFYNSIGKHKTIKQNYYLKHYTNYYSTLKVFIYRHINRNKYQKLYSIFQTKITEKRTAQAF
jgi:hypothetical protein